MKWVLLLALNQHGGIAQLGPYPSIDACLAAGQSAVFFTTRGEPYGDLSVFLVPKFACVEVPLVGVEE